MKVLARFNILPAAGAIVASLMSVGAMAELPQGDFACHVHTVGGAPGLVLVQSYTLEEARATARTSNSVLTVNPAPGAVVQVSEVVECIVRRGGKFKDVSFQAIYETLPI
jgi:hypothetical protein